MIQGHQYTKYFKGSDYSIFVTRHTNNYVTAIHINTHTHTVLAKVGTKSQYSFIMIIIDGPLLILHIVTYKLFKVYSVTPHNVSHMEQYNDNLY